MAHREPKNVKWFKFYGQDWLTDMKIMKMSMEDRLCYITLLSLASAAGEGGLVRNCDEDSLIKLSNIPDDPIHDFNPYEKAKGFLERCNALQIVTLASNGDVTVNAFERRQEQNLSNAERQKRYRERLKITTKPTFPKRNARYVTQSNDSNARIDKIRKENTESSSKEEPQSQITMENIRKLVKSKTL
jgi:hypothetical protein